MENDDLITGPVSGWRLMGGGIFDFDEPRLFARLAPEAIAYFLRDQTARDFSHRAWSWVTSLSEPLVSTCLVDTHTETPAPGCGCGWRVVSDFDDMAAYLRRMAGVGDHLVLARVETVGTLRASHARTGADPNGPLDDPASTVRAAAIRVTDIYLHPETHTKPAYGSPAVWLEQFGNDAEVHVPPTGEPFTLEQWISWVAVESGDDFDQAAAMAYLADRQVSTVVDAPAPSPDVCEFCGDDECECDPGRPGWRFFAAMVGGTSRRPTLLSWDLLLMAHHGRIPDDDLDYHHTGEMVARCVAWDHPAPARACECGYRMVNDLGKLHRYAMRHHYNTGNRGEYRHARKLEGLIAVARVQGSGTVYGPAFGDPRGTLRHERLTVTNLYLSQQVYARPDLYGTAEQWAEGFPDVEVHVPPEPRSLCSRWCRRGCTGCREWLAPAQWFEWIEADWARREAALSEPAQNPQTRTDSEMVVESAPPGDAPPPGVGS